MFNMTHSYVCDITHSCDIISGHVTWLIHMCDMIYSYVCDMTHSCVIISVYYGFDLYVTCLIHMCDMMPSYVWLDSFICVTWLIHMYVTWLIHVTSSLGITALICMWHASCMCVPTCVTLRIYMCDKTHSYVFISKHNTLTRIQIYIYRCIRAKTNVHIYTFKYTNIYASLIYQNIKISKY